ncbi:FAD:protein FMN transferase [Alcanivorax sediminis]|uniref:FAD:protein FMN transferase n=1 Tax=Alcanivorax sediminis TaxID=2663008 RepID=A0A6N7M295_9GAMM|nr:FAD:protein FMN transferase [Alcanivorax sediminis]MQX54290.1 FAD:protein FMN transferase [Alcanivorax sediminis]
MTRILSLLVLSLTLLLSACDDSKNRLSVLSGPTMGTTWSVKYTGTPDESIDSLKADIEAALEQVNAEMSTYRADSVLSQFNQAAAGTLVDLPADTQKVLKAAFSLSEMTGGAYDVTVGPLVNLWGFGPESDRFEPPQADEIEAARRRVGWQSLLLDGPRLLQPGEVYVDLSSIAKGFAVDKVAELMDKHGLKSWLVEVGGELRARGTKPYGQPWRIAVERPIPGVREVEQVVALKDMAVATSGDYRNFFESDGKLYSHTIDPRTGYPVQHALASVSVLHKSAMMADGLATAMTVLGPKEGMAFAKANELAVFFIVRTDEGVKELSTPAFDAIVEDK